MRRDPSCPLPSCSATVLDLYHSIVEKVPLGHKHCWFDELGYKAPSVAFVGGEDEAGKRAQITLTIAWMLCLVKRGWTQWGTRSFFGGGVSLLVLMLHELYCDQSESFFGFCLDLTPCTHSRVAPWRYGIYALSEQKNWCYLVVKVSGLTDHNSKLHL